MWTNTFCNVDKWIVWFGQIQWVINCAEKGPPERERTKCWFLQISWIFCDQIETKQIWLKYQKIYKRFLVKEEQMAELTLIPQDGFISRNENKFYMWGVAKAPQSSPDSIRVVIWTLPSD